MASSASTHATPFSCIHHATRAIELRGVLDAWLLGFATVFCGDYSGWNVGPTAGIAGLLLSTVLIGGAYLCFRCCDPEVTGAAGGSYGLARCTLGFFPAFLLGCFEAIESIGVIATTMIALAGMLVQIAPAWANSEPVVMLGLHVSVLCVQLLSPKSFWMGTSVVGIATIGIWLIHFISTVGHANTQANAVGDGLQLLIGGLAEFLRGFPISAWFSIAIEVLNPAPPILAREQGRNAEFVLLLKTPLHIVGSWDWAKASTQLVASKQTVEHLQWLSTIHCKLRCS